MGNWYPGIDPHALPKGNPFNMAPQQQPMQPADPWGGMRTMGQPSPMPAPQGAPAASPMNMTSRVKPYSPLMDPSGPLANAGWIGALMTGLGGGQTRQQHETEMQGAMFADATQYIQEKAPQVGAQQAILQYMQTPNGMNYMAKGGDMEALGKVAQMAQGDVLGKQRREVFNEAAQAPDEGGDQWAGMRAAGDQPPTKSEMGAEDYLGIAAKLTAMGDDEGAKIANQLAEQSRQIEIMRKPPTTEELTEYDKYVAQEQQAGRRPMDWLEYKTYLDTRKSAAGATRIDLNTVAGREQKATEAKIDLDKEAAKAMQDAYIKAQEVAPLLDEAERVSKSAPGGYAGVLASQLAAIADTFGFEVQESWSDAEKIKAISQRLVGLVRLPGPVSNYEQVAYLKAVPSLLQSREGRAKIVAMLKKQITRSKDMAEAYRSMIGKTDEERAAILDKLDKQGLFDESEKKLIERAGGFDTSDEAIPHVTNDADFDDLDPGTVFRDPKGQLRTKPGVLEQQTAPAPAAKPKMREPVFMPEPARKTRSGGLY